MKFYITIENTQRLKHSLLNIKLFSIICIPEILEQYGYTQDTIDDYGIFIINKHIDDLIKCYARSKRIRGIIYSNPIMNDIIISNLFETIKNIDTINEIVLFDDNNVPKLKHLYNRFDEIVFFPSIRKIRLIEARPFKDDIKWKA